MLVLGCEPGDEFLVGNSRLRCERIEPLKQFVLMRVWTHDGEGGELITVSHRDWLSVRCTRGHQIREFRIKLSTRYQLRPSSARLVFDADDDIDIDRQ